MSALHLIMRGASSRLLHPGTKQIVKSLSIISWNSRGLLHSDPKLRQKKVNALLETTRGADVILLQEVHPDTFLINKHLVLLLKEYHIKFSACTSNNISGNPVYNKGGLATMIRKTLVDKDASLELDEPIPGRASALRISLGAHSSTYWNIHNYGFTKSQVLRLHCLIRRDIVRCHGGPQHHSTWLLGDLNREPHDFPRIDINDPTKQTFPLDGHNSNSNFGFFGDALFADLVEIECSEPSHYSAEGHFLNKLDRFFITIPSHAWITVQPSIQVLVALEVAHYKGLSDHAILKCGVSLRAPPNPDTMPIRPECFSNPRFKERLDAWYKVIDLSSLGTWERWAAHEVILREAALQARNAIMLESQDSDFCIQGTISFSTRAIWRNDIRLAEKILQRSDFARRHVVVTDCRVMLISPTDYDNEISRLKHTFLANHADQLHSAAKAPFIKDARRKKLQSKKAATLRLQKLWLPASKRVTLHTLRVPNGSCSPKLATDPNDISQGLADAWRPVFQKKKIDVHKAQSEVQE